jgi:hypothetical protein
MTQLDVKKSVQKKFHVDFKLRLFFDKDSTDGEEPMSARFTDVPSYAIDQLPPLNLKGLEASGSPLPLKSSQDTEDISAGDDTAPPLLDPSGSGDDGDDGGCIDPELPSFDDIPVDVEPRESVWGQLFCGLARL